MMRQAGKDVGKVPDLRTTSPDSTSDNNPSPGFRISANRIPHAPLAAAYKHVQRGSILSTLSYLGT